jgi:hypothetical protein
MKRVESRELLVHEADLGCDLDFLVGPRQAGIPRESH